MLLDYVHHQNVNGQLDTMDKIRSFAVTQGWVQEDWVSGYRWSTDTESFSIADSQFSYLCLSSTGYGTQNLIVKMQTYVPYLYSGSDYAEDTFNLSMCSSTVNDTLVYYTQPYAQYALTQSNDAGQSRMNGMHIGVAQYDDLWIFGDDKFIFAALNMDGVFCQHLWFGSMIPYDDNPSQGFGRGLTAASNTRPWYEYKTTELTGCFHGGSSNQYFSSGGREVTGCDFYWEGRHCYGGSTTRYNCSNMFPISDYCNTNSDNLTLDYGDVFDPDAFLNIGRCLRANYFSGKRLLLRQTNFIQRSSDSLWVPVCKTPFYFVNFSGLTIGETLSYGDEDFIVIPYGTYQDPIGMAVQIS